MDGPPPPEEDFSQLPVADRLAHKNWKARVSAYETLIKTFQNTASDTDPAFKPYLNNPDTLKKIVTDANAVAQEKGVESVVAFVKFAGESAARTREAVVPALVDKCFGSTRAGTKNQAIELALQYVEVENGGSGVVGDVLSGLAAKQPKTVSGCVTALKVIMKTFGMQVTPPPPVLKALPKVFAHTDKTVRAEGTLLAQILYQYIGPAIEPWLADLKPVQVKELKESFDKMDSEGQGKGTLKVERFTRAQAREMESGVDVEEEAEEDLATMDPRALAEEVDIVPKLPSGLLGALASSKWKERKEALDDLLVVLNATPRIKDSPELGDVARGLAGRMTDANINCVMAAANCMEALAKGMMGHFARFREVVVTPMLERLKERKQNVTDAIGNALDAVFLTMTLPDVLENILPALGSKNPQVKEGTMKFLARCLTVSTVPPAAPQVKPLSEALAGLLEDSFEGARNEAAVCLGTLMKIVGERPLNAIMDQLADVRKVKVKEAHEKATVKCKAGSGPAARPAPTAAAKAPVKKGPAKSAPVEDALDEDVSPPKPKVKPPARLLAKKSPGDAAESGSSPAPVEPSKPAVKPPARLARLQTKKPATAVAAAAAVASSSKPSKSAAPVASGALDTFKFKHNPEDAEALATELIPTQIATDFADTNWKVRLAALEEMTTWVEGSAEEVDSEVITRFLIKRGSSEKNFQVSSKLYGILSILAERSPSFGRSSVAIATPHLSEKLGDMKLKKPAGEALVLFAEKTSLQFVLNQAYDALSKQKAPKVLADSMSWIENTLTEFGVAGVSLRSLIEFLKNALGNSNAAVRTSATKTLVTIKIFVGPSVKELLGEINPQLLATIQSEFDKAEGKPAPEPTRISIDVQNMGSSSGSSKVAAVGMDAMDDLFPRVELDGVMKGTAVLSGAKSDAWKTKKEALETLQAILDQGPNKRLKPNMGEIGQILKARVTDTNKAVQLLALDIIARIATGMDKPFEKHTRFFALPVATVLSDQKANIRQAGLATLSAIAEACDGVESMVHGFTTALETANPLQRTTLLNWIADWFKCHEPNASLDLSTWAAPIVSCLDDRSGDVRKAAQAALPYVIAQVGVDYVLQQTNSLKPASRSTVVPLVKAAAASVPEKSSKPTPAPVSVPASALPPAKTSAPTPSSPIPQSPPPVSSVPSASGIPAVGPASKLAGVRRKLPQGSIPRPESRASVVEDAPAPSSRLMKPGLGGLKRPTSSFASKPAAPVAPSPVPSALSPFTTMNLDAKKARLAKDGARWIIESGPTRKDLVDLLQTQTEPHTSKELFSLLFSRDHNAINDHISGLNMLCDFYSTLAAGDDRYGFSGQERSTVGIANADLALKYVSIRVHEPQPNLIGKCLDVIDNVMAFLRDVNYQLSDPEALCFVPTIINKLGDAREAVRVRVQQIIQTLPKVYAYSRVFQLLMDHGLKSKVAKTRQGSLDEMAGILKRTGVNACEPAKSFPVIASMISDKDAQVRKSALSALSEGYVLVGESLWTYVRALSPKDKTQLEERLRRVAGPSNAEVSEAVPAAASVAPTPGPASRLASGVPRPGSRIGGLGGLPRPSSPTAGPVSRLARPSSPVRATGPSLPSAVHDEATPAPSSRLRKSSIVPPTSPRLARPKSFLPSRLGPARNGPPTFAHQALTHADEFAPERPALRQLNGDHFRHPSSATDDMAESGTPTPDEPEQDVITLTISKILSSDAARSVDALKQIQKVLEVGPEEGPSSPQYRELSDHTEGLIETITLQMNHVFENASTVIVPENFRLAKHLIQTINAFCDHPLLAESLQVEILTGLFEELTLRLLQTDESDSSKVKDLSRFINMIILRLFATCRRMTVLRSLFALLLQIVKPFPVSCTPPESKEAKVAELVLKCIWKLARNIPTDLEKQELDPVELFPAIEHFLQSIPPNEWRARATNKVPSGDMPLRTIKVIIQHVVAFYGDEVYDLLSSSFEDPSATIVYPYVYRILNSSRGNTEGIQQRQVTNGSSSDRPAPGPPSQPSSPHARSSTASNEQRNSSPSRQTSQSGASVNGGDMLPPPVDEPDPDDQLLTIINHISSETTGAMHKEGITELHHFLKAYPHKKPRVDRMLENTGPAFRKYIARALASRAAEDQERTVAVADTLSKLESNSRDGQYSPFAVRDSASPKSPRRVSGTSEMAPAEQDKLSRLHDLFQYRASTTSNGSSQARSKDSDGT
ncbi:microtubule associated protein [Phellopilus nigrolimitatus]|nr:microtubule associated protein [Phellopilus nigrolimitatus]